MSEHIASVDTLDPLTALLRKVEVFLTENVLYPEELRLLKEVRAAADERAVAMRKPFFYEPTAVEVAEHCARTGMSPVAAREALTEERLATPAPVAADTLTDEQCNAFRRLPLSFNDMVRAIYEAGRGASPAREIPAQEQAKRRCILGCTFLRGENICASCGNAAPSSQAAKP